MSRARLFGVPIAENGKACLKAAAFALMESSYHYEGKNVNCVRGGVDLYRSRN